MQDQLRQRAFLALLAACMYGMQQRFDISLGKWVVALPSGAQDAHAAGVGQQHDD